MSLNHLSACQNDGGDNKIQDFVGGRSHLELFIQEMPAMQKETRLIRFHLEGI